MSSTLHATTVRGGRLVLPDGTRRVDIGIDDDGRIAAIEPALPPGRQDINAEGLHILPGGVDSHCHIEQKTSTGLTPVDDFFSASVSALAGGTTTLVPFACQHRGHRVRDVVAAYRKTATKCACDYAIHIIVADPSEPHAVEDLRQCIAEGYSSLKVYMTYDALKLKDEELLDVLELCRQHAAMVMVHAESSDLIAWITRRLLSAECLAARYHAVARPAIAEREATHRAITFAEFVGTPLLIVHVSSSQAADEIARARARGLPIIFGETCPQYLVLTQRCLCLAGNEGNKFLCSPPLRTEADQEALWAALRRGDLHVVSSDHSAYHFGGGGAASKTAGGPSTPFSKVPMGLPGLECRMPLLFSGALRGQLHGLEQVVRVACENPAKLYGLFPRKGTLQLGSDADLVLWDSSVEHVLTKDALHDTLDYTPYEGVAVRGQVMRTLLRGQTVFERRATTIPSERALNGIVSAVRGAGQFVAGGRPDLVLGDDAGGGWSRVWPDDSDLVQQRCVETLGPELDGCAEPVASAQRGGGSSAAMCRPCAPGAVQASIDNDGAAAGSPGEVQVAAESARSAKRARQDE